MMKVHDHPVEHQHQMEQEQQSAPMIALDIEFFARDDSTTIQPLTVVAKHQIREDHRESFILWCREISALARGFRGYISAEVIKPMSSSESHEYLTIFRFDNYAHLRVWMNSTERADMYERVLEISEHPSVYSFHFLEHWFPSDHTTPKEEGGGPPRKYKMVLVTTVIIYSLNCWVPIVTKMVAPSVNTYLRGFFNTLIIVIIAAYTIFPVVTRLLAFWLVPGAIYTEVLRELVPSSVVCKLWPSNQSKEATTHSHDDSIETVVPTGLVGAEVEVVDVDREENSNAEELPV